MRFLLVCALATPLMPAQTKPAPATGPMADAGAANLPEQSIGADDLLAIAVYDSPEFTRTVRVSADGSISLPMLDEPIPVQGLRPSQVSKAISETLVRKGILVKPVIMVTVVEYYSRPIAIVGAVKKPTTFQAVGRTTLLDALGHAEGLSDDAGPDLVVRRSDGSLETINVRDLIDAAKPEKNLLLTGGEEIRVPQAKKIYVAGDVKKPGAFEIRDDGQMTVLRATALAEGVDAFAQHYAWIYRPDPSGGRRQIRIEFSKIMKRQAPDVALEPDDTLYIPEDHGRKVAVTAADKLVGFGSATASGVLIWRK